MLSENKNYDTQRHLSTMSRKPFAMIVSRKAPSFQLGYKERFLAVVHSGIEQAVGLSFTVILSCCVATNRCKSSRASWWHEFLLTNDLISSWLLSCFCLFTFSFILFAFFSFNCICIFETCSCNAAWSADNQSVSFL